MTQQSHNREPLGLFRRSSSFLSIVWSCAALFLAILMVSSAFTDKPVPTWVHASFFVVMMLGLATSYLQIRHLDSPPIRSAGLALVCIGFAAGALGLTLVLIKPLLKQALNGLLS